MSKKLFKYFCLSFITIILLTSCNKTTNLSERPRSTSEQQKNLDETVPKTATPSTRVMELDTFEYRFYSPNKDYYIVEQIDNKKLEGEPLPVTTRLYFEKTLIDTATYPWGYEHKQKKTHVIWVDNENVIINGVYILNIEKMTKEAIPFPKELRNSQHILNYRYDPTGKVIAYMSFQKYKENTNGMLTITLYDLQKKSWKNIFAKEIVWMPDWEFDSGVNQLFWDNDRNVYFNYPVGNDFPQVVQFNSKTEETLNISSEFILFDSSPDRKLFIIQKDEGIKTNYYVMKSDTRDIIYQIPSNRYAWSIDTPGELAIVTYDSPNLNSSRKVDLEVVSLIDLKVIKKISDDRFIVPKRAYTLVDSHDDYYILKIDEKILTIKVD